MVSETEEKVEKKEPIFKDVRRYQCQYCGIFRSKKTLISNHIKEHHKDEVMEEEEEEVKKENECEECGLSFKKPAHLKQHMQSHSLERCFTCPLEDCHCSYRRKDHLTRHLLQHQGKLFECPIDCCKRRFAFQGNMMRHVKDFHGDSSYDDYFSPKQHVCPEVGCGKVFEYPSKLKKHMDSHVKLDSVEAFCSEPGCMKYFSNEKCLKEHLQSCHQHIICEICGTKQLKKNIKRHLCIHEPVTSEQRVPCTFEGCERTFSTKSNLNLHIKAVHSESRQFVCGVSGCGRKFQYKHVRDKHEMSGCHVFTHGDFEETDEQFQMRNRGGQKRKLPPIESIMRKRIVPQREPDSTSTNVPAYLSCGISAGADSDL
ncbi:C2H2 zinc finger transcription factor [Lithospermum erythrorhizon]|uniref:C2H2 zinc finger transcription factor n=1 Tax=Lithospermum erythrorhizon TaxID=34254 RepID=A0AAV3QPR8_LITER